MNADELFEVDEVLTRTIQSTGVCITLVIHRLKDRKMSHAASCACDRGFYFCNRLVRQKVDRIL